MNYETCSNTGNQLTEPILGALGLGQPPPITPNTVEQTLATAHISTLPAGSKTPSTSRKITRDLGARGWIGWKRAAAEITTSEQSGQIALH